MKTALQKLKEYWQNLPPVRKKIIVMATAAIIALALGLVLFLNFSGSSMTLLYEGLESGESVEIYNALKELGVSARLNAAGQVEVRRADKDRAIGQLAMQNYPKSALPYQYFTGGSGLTTTDMERREFQKQGLQDRLQSTIRLYEGVKNVVVSIDMPTDSTFPWSGSTKTATGSVSLVLESGYTPTRDQVSGIKYLVSKSVGQGMIPADVAVIDAATWVNLKSREDDGNGTDAESERLLLQEKVEQTLVDKARNVLSIAYPPENMRVSATVAYDYSKVVTESMEYKPSEDSANNTGVLEHEELNTIMGSDQLAQGVAGEEDNTDTVPGYVDQNGDGNPDVANYSRLRDFAVPYIMQQIEKDNAEIVTASLAIMLKGALAPGEREVLIENVSKATGIAEDNISIQGVDLGEEPQPNGLPTLQEMIPYFAIVFGLILLLIVIMILASRGKKRKKKKKGVEESVKEEEPAIDPALAEEQWQKELEDHKRHLQEAAKTTQKEEAIVSEVREFAQENPEITAGLLRAWLNSEEEE